MTLPFAFVFIAAFAIVAIFLVSRKSITKKKEVKETASRQESPQGPVDTSEMSEKAKAPLKKRTPKTQSHPRKVQ
ncbi:MAG: hypothetical protein JST19_11040 [Bacteroidetes bacterium]|nr:hypothetical protein [Bacteroidota bacterium]